MNSIETPAMNEASIAEYLLQHPEFFERHAEMLTAVHLSSGHGQRAVSLQERQAEMLRDKIKGLEGRIMEMVRNSSENSAIAHKIHRWSCNLAAVQDVRATAPRHCRRHSKRIRCARKSASACGMWLGLMLGQLFTMGVSEDAKSFATSLTMPFCGPNLGFEPTAWLPNPSEVQSMALLTLREGPNDSQSPAFGLLVLGSPDPLRFDATMGTEFSRALPSRPAPRWGVCARCLRAIDGRLGASMGMPDAVALAPQLQAYLQHVASERRLAPRTVAIYTEGLQQLQAMAAQAGHEVLALQPPQIRRFVAALHAKGRHGRSIALWLSCWRGFFNGRRGRAG